MTTFALVPIRVGGPRTFRCSRCYASVTQHHEEIPTVTSLEYRRGAVWADLDGEPYIDYYCTPCKQLTEERNDG